MSKWDMTTILVDLYERTGCDISLIDKELIEKETELKYADVERVYKLQFSRDMKTFKSMIREEHTRRNIKRAKAGEPTVDGNDKMVHLPDASRRQFEKRRFAKTEAKESEVKDVRKVKVGAKDTGEYFDMLDALVKKRAELGYPLTATILKVSPINLKKAVRVVGDGSQEVMFQRVEEAYAQTVEKEKPEAKTVPKIGKGSRTTPEKVLEAFVYTYDTQCYGRLPTASAQAESGVVSAKTVVKHLGGENQDWAVALEKLIDFLEERGDDVTELRKQLEQRRFGGERTKAAPAAKKALEAVPEVAKEAEEPEAAVEAAEEAGAAPEASETASELPEVTEEIVEAALASDSSDALLEGLKEYVTETSEYYDPEKDAMAEIDREAKALAEALDLVNEADEEQPEAAEEILAADENQPEPEEEEEHLRTERPRVMRELKSAAELARATGDLVVALSEVLKWGPKLDSETRLQFCKDSGRIEVCIRAKTWNL